MVGEDAVELLGHRAVERAHPRLDVGDRDAGLRGGQPAGERRVRVAVDEHDVGPLGGSSGPRAASMRAVCSVFVPPRMPSSRSGRGTPSSAKKTVEARRRSAGRCGRAARRAPARSGRETAAALTNCGRFPMTVRTRSRAAVGRRRARARCARARARAPRASARRAPRAARRRRSARPAAPRGRRGQERLLRRARSSACTMRSSTVARRRAAAGA